MRISKRVLAASFVALPVSEEEPFDLALGEEALRFTPPALEGRTFADPKDEQLKARWVGKRGESQVEVEVRVYPLEAFPLNEPEDVLDMLERNYADPKRKGEEEWAFDSTSFVEGKFGWVPYAALGVRAGRGGAGDGNEDPGRRRAEGDVVALGGILEKFAYSLEVLARPPLPEAERRAIADGLAKGLTARSRARDPAWSEEEVRERWKRDAPDEKVRAGLEKPVRTKHYLILTNSSSGPLFAKKMEEFHERVRKVFPFEDRRGERLLPVFLFRTSDQYYDFYVRKTGVSRGAAARSKGHAWRDYYATWYEAPNDPTHLHEATHQIFRNRLRLPGGGSWFQEGVAEYVSNAPNETKSFAKRAAKDGKFIPFRTFVRIPSLIQNPHLDAQGSYLQAGSLVHFLREGKFQPEKFPRFLEEVGRLPRGDVARIEQAVRSIYGVDLEGLEKAWADYWKRA
ncbi:MAG TPA: hypothetical protein VFI25_12260 [Planctomycetota bacterium]|jgi:hypothetical protein|nr:hypothetical protein [Planctomycetota bacterium]